MQCPTYNLNRTLFPGQEFSITGELDARGYISNLTITACRREYNGCMVFCVVQNGSSDPALITVQVKEGKPASMLLTVEPQNPIQQTSQTKERLKRSLRQPRIIPLGDQLISDLPTHRFFLIFVCVFFSRYYHSSYYHSRHYFYNCFYNRFYCCNGDYCAKK